MENDMLPTKICSRCIFSLEASLEFHDICDKADKTLKGFLAEQHPDVVINFTFKVTLNFNFCL